MPLIELPETGNAYVAIDELRRLPNLGDETMFTDDDLAEAREWFETTFEEFTQMAFVQRAATDRLDGQGRPTLLLSHYPIAAVTAVRIYTTASAFTSLTTDDLSAVVARSTGELSLFSNVVGLSLATQALLGGGASWPFGFDNIEVDYVHGQAVAPADVKRAEKTAVQERLMQDRSGRPIDRTYGTASDGVFVRNMIEDEKHPFGIASVDAVACRYRARYRVPAIA